jgi:hypothetical protein
MRNLRRFLPSRTVEITLTADDGNATATEAFC